MTTNPKAARYNVRRVDRPAVPEGNGGGGGLFDTEEDGFGNMDFRRDEDRPPQPPEAVGADVASAAALAGLQAAQAMAAQGDASDPGTPGVQQPAPKALLLRVAS